MAYYRQIYTTFWTDAKVADDFTPEDKYFYLYLLTNAHTTLCGCYEISDKQISNDTGYTVDVVTRLLNRMQEVHRVIVRDKETKEVLLLNWHKYNWNKSEKVLKGVSKEIERVKCQGFKKWLNNLVAWYGGDDTVSIGYPYPMDTSVSVTVTDTVSNTVNNINNNINNIKHKKHKHGEYNNVLLTDDELEKLKEEYPDYRDRIENLSNYIASTGKVYKSHYATIRNWARKDEKKKTGTFDVIKAWAEEE